MGLASASWRMASPPSIARLEVTGLMGCDSIPRFREDPETNEAVAKKLS